MENKAFFVTYLPGLTHSTRFEITDTGMITEKSEFIVSGWNDFFRPVESDTRLVGIGYNDTANTRKLAISLYDVTDLTNPNPLLAREEIDLDWGWSEASWDDRAFTVLEKGTSVLAADGTLETGLILLPFQGYDSQKKEYVSAVQIFTFSATTLTARGLMTHDDPVRRSFVADRSDNTIGNMSEQELKLHDATLPDAPVELGSVQLAPDYNDFIVLGQYALRRQNRQSYYSWWGNSATNATDDLQVVALSGDPDAAEAVAEIQIPAYAQLTKVGNVLAVSNQTPKDINDYSKGFDTEVQLWDFTDPTVPVLASSKVYSDLPVNNYYDYRWGYGGFEDCFDCTVARFSYWGGQYGPMAVGDAIVFPEVKYESEVVGTLATTNLYPTNQGYDRCYDYNTGTPKACTFDTGGIYCSQLTRLDGTVEAEVCQGGFYTCTQTLDGERTCVEADKADVPHETSTYSYEQSRWWYHYDLHVLDVSNPATPSSVNTISMDTKEEAVSLLPKDDSLYVNFKKPITVPGDARPYVAYQIRRIDLSNPAVPVVKPDVNIPGELLDVDGTTLVTRDFLWGQNIVETSINKLKLQGNLAVLQGVRRFQDKLVEQVQLDGAGRVLVTERNMWNYYDYYSQTNDYTLRLNILDLANAQLPILATADIDTWAQLKAAITGRALFTIPGGLLVVNLDTVTAPYAQAYFPTKGWPQAFELADRSVYFAAGPFGVFTFDLDEFNLLAPNTP
ncbi:MAG: beta-propeller domain-containing protein [bacterium]